MPVKDAIKQRGIGTLRNLGFELERVREYPRDFEQADKDLYAEVAPFTMTGPAAVYALADAVRYIERLGIRGAVVESGVWRGGSMMAVARTLVGLGSTERDLYLFDTYEGMPEPTAKDVRWSGSA